MPIYSFENDKGETWDEMMSWDDRCIYLKENPTIKQIITGAPNINKGGTGDRTKPDGGFNPVPAEGLKIETPLAAIPIAPSGVSVLPFL